MLDTIGSLPRGLRIVSPRGCDRRQIRLDTAPGVVGPHAPVPPLVLAHHRLHAPHRVPNAHPVVVDAANPLERLVDQLAEPAGKDVHTVVWPACAHYVMRYPDPGDIDAVLNASGVRVIRIGFEPPRCGAMPRLQLVRHGPNERTR